MSNEKSVKILSISVILLSLSLILGYIEAIFPINIGQVGIKLGLGNLVSLIGLKTLTVKRVLIINLLRLLILGIIFGNMVRFIISISGFVFSFLIMVIMIKVLNCRIIVSSIFGGVSHNLGQFFALVIILHNASILALFPIYIIIGIITGAFVGVISDIIYNKVQYIIS